MILGLATDAQTTRFEAREQHTNELSETGGV
jgi:hypothetical protein